MYAKLIYILVFLTIAFLLYRWFVRSPPQVVAQQLKRWGLIGLAAVLLIMVATGRMHWLFAVLGGLLPFAQRVFALLRGYQLFRNMKSQIPGMNRGSGNQSGQSSTIETQFLRMTLDHDSGELSGVVLAGRYQGTRLEDLELQALMTLLTECRIEDDESARLLETYLDRSQHQAWREQSQDHGSAQQSAPGPINQDEAYAILGLQPGAGAEEIKAAHRRLMQKMHPDRGGSTYLATKINQAKDLLLQPHH